MAQRNYVFACMKLESRNVFLVFQPLDQGERLEHSASEEIVLLENNNFEC